MQLRVAGIFSACELFLNQDRTNDNMVACQRSTPGLEFPCFGAALARLWRLWQALQDWQIVNGLWACQT
jgi:hypothetical protein